MTATKPSASSRILVRCGEAIKARHIINNCGPRCAPVRGSPAFADTSDGFRDRSFMD